ncbi:phage tail protein [Aquabacter cavernae]|uniref:phage tail protein n=1 Tax=Aquabacter cavernae TaxID=2496029 RepID=UPI000F8C3242|nr:tail fiber protein [Aquabacter cavernae]
MVANLGEIRLFAFPQIPGGWLVCDGKIYSRAENTPLFSLLLDTYGGDGKTTFGVPDLRGRVILGASLHADRSATPATRYTLGERGGQETVFLTEEELPTHHHMVVATDQPASVPIPKGGVFAAPAVMASQAHSPIPIYGDPPIPLRLRELAPGTVLPATGRQRGHGNMQPSIVLNYCICASGQYPSK